MNQAPGGWGFVPGFVIGEVTAADLPDLVMLPLLTAPTGRVVEASIAAVPGLAFRISPRMLVEKYGLAQATASDLLSRIRKGNTP
jgi:hypothetical protein